MASSYAFFIKSCPQKAEIIINKVDFGVWKLVIIHVATLKSCGGKINLFVQPSKGFKVLCEETELSMARIDVVPTAQIRFLFDFASFTISQASSVIFNSSESILCFDKSSTSTGLKVPKPT